MNCSKGGIFLFLRNEKPSPRPLDIFKKPVKINMDVTIIEFREWDLVDFKRSVDLTPFVNA
jgi:hypothetical protein